MMDFRRRSLYLDVLLISTLILPVFAIGSTDLTGRCNNTIYCENGTLMAVLENRRELLNITCDTAICCENGTLVANGSHVLNVPCKSTIYCVNGTHVEKHSGVNYFCQGCRTDSTDSHGRWITKECSTNKTDDNETEVCKDRNVTCNVKRSDEEAQYVVSSTVVTVSKEESTVVTDFEQHISTVSDVIQQESNVTGEETAPETKMVTVSKEGVTSTSFQQHVSAESDVMLQEPSVTPSDVIYAAAQYTAGRVELKLTLEPRKKYLVEGTMIRLNCCLSYSFNGSAVTNFQWSIGGQSTTNNWTQTTEEIGKIRNTAFSILNLSNSHSGSGTIRCSVNYTYSDINVTVMDSLSPSLKLTVFRRPFVTISPKVQQVNDSQMFVMTCKVTSEVNGQVQFNWYEDGEPIDQFCGSRRITSHGQTVSQLHTSVRVQSVPITYSCMAETVLGNTERSHSKAIVFNYNAKFCESEHDQIRSINWTRTKVRSKDFQPCPGFAEGNCSRNCSLNETSEAVWSPANCTLCIATPFRELLHKVNKIEHKAIDIDNNKTVDIAKQLSEATNKTNKLTQFDLKASLDIIDALAILQKGKTADNKIANSEEITSVVQGMSNILRTNNSKAWEQLQAEDRNVTVILMTSADVYGRSLSKIANETKKEIITEYMVLEARSLDQSELPNELEFPSRSFEGDERIDKILISRKALEKKDGSKLNIWSSYYRNINNYLPSNNRTEIMSRVLSLTVDGLKAEENLSQPVIVTLQHNEGKNRLFPRTCVFWNSKLGSGGEWDGTGCSVVATYRTRTVCSCNHLTNFAILMSLEPSDSETLSIISTIGSSISVAALILTVVFYVATWKKRKSDQAIVLLFLCVSLIIANIVFLAGADKTSNENGCIAVAILLHYFFLAAFFMMLAEGVELLLYIIFVFHIRTKTETALLVGAAWGLPFVIVGTSLGVKGYDEYTSQGSSCWLPVNNGLIWAFVGPAFCITAINFLILAIVLRRISQARLSATDDKQKLRIRAMLWNISVIGPVLGATWAFGVLSISFKHDVFQYLFAIANSFQGVLIFIFHAVLRNKKISDICCKPKKPAPDIQKKQPGTHEEKKKGNVAKLVNYFNDLEKSGEYDASRNITTSIGLSSTTDHSTTNDYETSVTAEVHSGDASAGSATQDGVSVTDLPTAQTN